MMTDKPFKVHTLSKEWEETTMTLTTVCRAYAQTGNQDYFDLAATIVQECYMREDGTQATPEEARGIVNGILALFAEIDAGRISGGVN